MPQNTLRVERPLDLVWTRLQELETWEGIGGMKQLRSARHRNDGSLAGFEYSLDTPLGAIEDSADARATTGEGQRAMHVQTETKGLRVTIDLSLTAENSTATTAVIVIDAAATNFLTKPLASTLRSTLDSGIERESARMVERLERLD